MLRPLDSGCQFPVGGHAFIKEGRLELLAFVGSMDGKTVLKESITGDPDDAAQLGESLAERLIAKGARDILENIA